MRDSDLRDFFQKTQESITVSDDLRERTLEFVEAEAARETNGWTTVKPVSAVKPTHQPAARRHTVQTIGFAAAACLIAIALVMGLGKALPFSMKASNEEPSPINPVPTSSFILQAYAATGSTPLAFEEDGMIVFSRDRGYLFSNDTYETEGYYTGCLFSVQGEGIVRVQASTSRGVLYRQTYEEFKAGDQPQMWCEAISWDPSKRGTGAYFATYDNVIPVRTDSSNATDDPNATVQVRLSKKLGSTIDVALTPGASDEYRFGFWTNDPIPNKGDRTEEVIDLFDGETLTVTVEFEDGSTATKVFELHAATMKAVPVDNAVGSASGLKALPEFANADDLKRANASLHTIYGSLVEENDEPFPGSLEEANNQEDSVDTTYEFPREDLLTRQKDAHGDDASLRAESILDKNGHALLAEANQTYDGNSYPPLEVGEGDGLFEITNISIKQAIQLPHDVSIYDTNFVSPASSLEYAQKVSSETKGYTLEADGALTGQGVLLEISMDVTNVSSVEAYKTTSGFSWLGILENDETRHYDTLNATFLYTDWWQHNRWNDDFVNRETLAPGETRRMTQLFAVPAAYANDPNLYFSVYDSFSSESSPRYYAFMINR